MPPYRADTQQTQHVDAGGVRYAYRRFGPRGGLPLILSVRFRGTMDHWDPAFLDKLAVERDLIVFDNAGISESTGQVPTSIAAMSRDAVTFVTALGLSEVDWLGWSMGGQVAQLVALDNPGLVRRLVVAGSGPGTVPSAPTSPPKVWQVAGKPLNDDEDFLYLFFPETEPGRRAGLSSLRRLDTRLRRSNAVVSTEGVASQMAALAGWRDGTDASWDRLHQLTLPTLIANGTQDVMVPALASYAMAQRMPHVKLVLYSDAGHGFLFQHIDDFTAEVLTFLRWHGHS